METPAAAPATPPLPPAAGPGCDCSNISIMQLFHELKQKFPAVPDRVVSDCIRKNAHDKASCEALLRAENRAYLLHTSYPASLKMSAPAGAAQAPAPGAAVCCCSQGRPQPATDGPGLATPPQRPSSLPLRRPLSAPEPPPLPPPTPPGGARPRPALSAPEEQPRPFPPPPPAPPLSSPEGGGASYSLSVNCSVERVLDSRVRTSLRLEPAPHFQPQQPRSFTSVNLTLRSPAETQPPPQPLTYSTASWDPAQGFQSQLRICIGPGGAGSVQAARTRPPPPATAASRPPPRGAAAAWRAPAPPPAAAPPSPPTVPDTPTDEELLRAQVRALGGDRLLPYTQELLARQLDRKNRLERALRREQDKLRRMQDEARAMEADLARRRARPACLCPVSSVLQKVQRLRDEIHQLQEECKKMTQEVDLRLDPRVPLGETDEEFYKNIYTGQCGVIMPPEDSPLSPNSRSQHFRYPGPSNTHVTGMHHETPLSGPAGETGTDGPSWTCSECTFRNHPLMDKCEQCEMPRIPLGTSTATDGLAVCCSKLGMLELDAPPVSFPPAQS